MKAWNSSVVNKLSGFLEERPSTFEITILPSTLESNTTTTTTTTANDTMDGGTVLSLDQSLVLVDGDFLGLDARSLPWITQEIRDDYKRQRKQGNAECLDILRVTSCLLLVNPDHATAWADRRRSLLQTCVTARQAWTNELQFLNLVMTQHSKARATIGLFPSTQFAGLVYSPSSWGHRKYVLQKIVDDLDASSPELDTVVTGEIRVCRQVAERYPKNYYAWTHRRYLWTVVSPAATLLQDEWKEIVTTWLPLHVSDHSAAHYGAQALAMMLAQTAKDSDNTTTASMETSAMDALSCVASLIERHPFHESLWILRRTIHQVMLPYADQSAAIAKGVADDMRRVRNLSHGMVESSVHALTFLVWMSHLLQNTKVDSDLVLMDELGGTEIITALRNHADVNHQLWSTLG